MPGRLGGPTGVHPSVGVWGGTSESGSTGNTSKPATPRTMARRYGGSRVLAQVDNNQAGAKPGVTSTLKLT